METEKIDVNKQTIRLFVVNELVIFVSQVFVFFMVAVFTSNLLSDEAALASYAELKINDGSMQELLLTFLAILVTVGIFAAIGRVFSGEIANRYINEILNEIPRVVYIFGSSVTGVLLALAVFLTNNPDNNTNTEGYYAVTATFAASAYIYGCLLSYAFKRKTHIIQSA